MAMRWIVALVVALAAPTASANDADFKALIAAERAFAARAQEIGWRKAFAEYFADDNLMFLPGPTAGRPVFLADKPSTATVEWGPSGGEVAAAGEMGYTYGNAIWRSLTDPAAAPTGSQFLSVWQRDAKGRFRNVFDFGVTHAATPIATSWVQRGPKRANPARLTPAQGNARLQALVQADRALATALMNADVSTGYAAVVAEDIAWLRNGSLPRYGRESIPSEAAHPRTDLATLRLAASGDLGFSAGWNGDAAAPVQYARVWRWGDGRWHLALDLLGR
jgi:hypothetical protein